jgi:hypothetical protein
LTANRQDDVAGEKWGTMFRLLIGVGLHQSFEILRYGFAGFTLEGLRRKPGPIARGVLATYGVKLSDSRRRS